MIAWNYIMLGAIITILLLRTFKNEIIEIFGMGVLIYFFVEYKYWFTEFLGFPHLSFEFYQFISGMLFAWMIARAIYVIAAQNWLSFLPFRQTAKFIFGKNAKL